MYVFPKTEKAIRTRISRYKSALKKEKATHGVNTDGGGKRYLLFWLLFVLNDQKKLKAHIDWFENEFPGDVGEPVAQLCWAVGLYRMGRDVSARHKLAELMLNNLYVIPSVIGEPVKRHDMWHGSNWSEVDYAEEIPEQVREGLNDDDKAWMRAQFESFEFRRVRKRYIEIYHELEEVRDLDSRSGLLNEARELSESIRD